MTEDRIRLVIIIGSIRAGRFGPTVADWFAAQARQRADLEVDVIDLAEAALPEILPDGDDSPQSVRELAPWLAEADAFVVVTPEYNHSFPASLKTAIDWFFDEWQAKPVSFVSYGGISGGLRAVEQLRLVFAELHAMTIRNTVSFHDYPELFDQDGQPTEPQRCNSAAKSMLDQLTWWAHALRNQRARQPYQA